MMFTAPVLWFAAAVVFGGLEMVVPAGAFLFFAVGCLGGWLAALAGLTSAWQVASAVAVCVLSVIFLRRRLARVFSGRETDARSDEPGRSDPAAVVASGNLGLKGRTGRAATVLEQGEEGQIEVAGSFWRAVCPTDDIPVGAGVRVTGVSPSDVLLLVVEPVAAPEEAGTSEQGS